MLSPTSSITTPWVLVYCGLYTWLWNLAFAGQARTSRCKHCFSLAHQSTDCDLAPEPPTKTYQNSQWRQLCFCWNKVIAPTCAYPNCKYQHILYICAHDSAVTNVSHKTINCPQHTSQPPIRPIFPTESTPPPKTSNCLTT